MGERLIQNRLIENIHVGLWLTKDLCWMMEWKWVGTIMIFPTVIAALWLLVRSAHRFDFWINLAVFFWILGNASWMLVEFFHRGIKEYAFPFFVLGFLSFGVFLYHYFLRNDVGE